MIEIIQPDSEQGIGTMKLENNYYELIRMHCSGTDGVFHLALRPDCEIYRGHFPGTPVCPGVCNIQMIKECVERLTGCRLHIGSIRRCRLTAVATPMACPELSVKINLQPTENGFAVTATVSDARRTYMDYKGEMTV